MLAAEVFSLNDKAVDAPAPIVVERPLLLVPRSRRDVSTARPSGSEPLAPYPSRIAGTKAPTTNVNLRMKAAGTGPANALTGLGSCRLTPCLTPSVAHSAAASQGPDRRCPDALRRLRSAARGGRR